jgi:hypothetical protein
LSLVEVDVLEVLGPTSETAIFLEEASGLAPPDALIRLGNMPKSDEAG